MNLTQRQAIRIKELEVQLTDAHETIHQNRLTIERLQNMVNEKRCVDDSTIDQRDTYKEIALNLSRHLVQTSQTFEDKYPDQ